MKKKPYDDEEEEEEEEEKKVHIDVSIYFSLFALYPTNYMSAVD